jgi:hypothetical protein
MYNGSMPLAMPRDMQLTLAGPQGHGPRTARGKGTSIQCTQCQAALLSATVRPWFLSHQTWAFGVTWALGVYVLHTKSHVLVYMTWAFGMHVLYVSCTYMHVSCMYWYVSNSICMYMYIYVCILFINNRQKLFFYP